MATASASSPLTRRHSAPSLISFYSTAPALISALDFSGKSSRRGIVRKQVQPARSERQRLDQADGGERQLAVEVGKEGAAVRRLPFQRRLEHLGIDRHLDEIVC